VREDVDRKRLRVLSGIHFDVSFDLQALTHADVAPKRSVLLLIEELSQIIGTSRRSVRRNFRS